MLKQFRRLEQEKRKMLLSISSSLMTRLPGVIGVIWFLPLLHDGLGTEVYAELLSALALVIAATFLARGMAIAGRRYIGEAYSDHNRRNEADGLVSLVVAQVGAFGVAFLILGIHGWLYGVSTTIFLITAVSAFGSGFLNQFNDVRAAYNEHYVTSMIMLVLQSSIYAVGLLLPATRHSVWLGALIIQSAYWLTSAATIALLLIQRPYLRRGRPRIKVMRTMLQQGAMITMADGLLLTSLSLSVVWLQDTSSAAIAAWFATLVRLFITLFTPVTMLLMPLSGYIRLRWNSKSTTQRQALMRVTALGGIGYGISVALALLVASSLYVNRMLHLPTPPLSTVAPIFILFGAMIAYHSYASMAYVVIEKSNRMSGWVTMTAGAAVIIGACVRFALTPLAVVNIYALITGVSLFMIIVCFSGFGPQRT